MGKVLVRQVKKQEPTGITLKKEDFATISEYKKAYDREYNKLTRARRRELYQLNKEYKQKQARDYRKNNPDVFKKINDKRNNEYYTNDMKRKLAVERGWSNANIRYTPDETFNHFNKTTHCESCNCELIKGKGMGKNKKVLDHDHFSGYPRNVICHTCNVWRRGYDNRRMRLHLELYRYFHLV